MRRRTIPAALLAAASLALAAPDARALESVVVEAVGASEEVQRLLERASTTARAQREAGAQDRTLTAAEAVSAARAEYREMLGALYSEGYYSGVVRVEVDGREAADLSLITPPARVSTVTIRVEPGRRFRFARADLAPMPPETALPEGYAVGEIARVDTIRRAGRAGVAGWRAAGHAKARLSEQTIVADHPNARLSSDLRLDPGPQVRFGQLKIAGNETVRGLRVRAIAGLPVGEVFDPQALDDAAERLRRTGAFRAITLVEGERVRSDGTIGIEAQLVEQPPRRIGGGAEVSSTEGLSLTAFWMHRNLFGGAENLRFDAEIRNLGSVSADNGVDYRIAGRLVRPATPVRDVDAQLGFEIAREDEPGYLSDSVEVGIGARRYVSRKLEVTAGLRYRYSDVEDAFGSRTFSMLVLPVGVVRDDRDVELDPTRGTFLNARARPFFGIDGIEDGAQVTADARAYLGLGAARRVVLAGRAQVGGLFGPDVAEAPPDYLFFAGGGGSVRGQPYQSIGTDEIDGTVVGGTSYLGLSGEVRAYVRGPLGLAAFYDAGYVGAEEGYDGSGNWASGAGLGLRYDTGFGPVRVDVATPVDGGPDDADAVQIYIGIGQAF